METPRFRDLSITNLCIPTHTFKYEKTYFVGGYHPYDKIAYMFQAKKSSNWRRKVHNYVVIYWLQGVDEVSTANKLRDIFTQLKKKPKSGLDKILLKNHWSKFGEWEDLPEEIFSAYIREIEHLVLQDI